MIRALNSAASGMGALQFKLDVIANNLANAGTTAFKRSRCSFEDTFYQYFKLPGMQDNAAKLTAVGWDVGLGTRVQGTPSDFSNGSLLDSGGMLDLAIVGDGFFQVQSGSGLLYTRAGNFTVNNNGEIVMASADRGRLLEPALTIPQDTENISISPDGIVAVKQAGSDQLNQLGTIQLVRFLNPNGLIQRGENLYEASQASGNPLVNDPGVDGMGTIRQRFLEASNVEPVRELVDLITTQRNFELNSQIVQAADQSLQLVANLRRF